MSIFYAGNTYLFGATIGPITGTGTTSYVFGGLSSGTSYGFLIWAFNSGGTSSIVGPLQIFTSSISPFVAETRDAISAFAWSYQYQPSYDISYRSSGITGNLFASSADLSNTFAWPWSSIAGGYTAITGYTAPDGSTTAWNIVAPANASRKNFLQTSFVDIGATYVASYYLNVTDSVLGGLLQRPSSEQGNWIQVDPDTGAIIPVTPDGFGNARVQLPAGKTGWQRFNFVLYNSSTTRTAQLALLWYGGTGITTQAIIWGPQLEKKS